MSKIIRNLAVITVCLTSVTAMAANMCHNFTGPYIGGNVGYGYGKGKMTAAFNADNSLYSNVYGISGVRGGLHGGYGQQFANKAYVGIEAAADYSNTFAKANDTDLNKFQTRRRAAYGLALRLGGVLGAGMLTYIKAGVESARWKTTGQYSLGGNVVAPTGQNKRVTGTIFGIGMETLVTKNIMVGGECAYTFYNKSTNLTTVDPLNTALTQTYTFKPRTADFRLRVSYKW